MTTKMKRLSELKTDGIYWAWPIIFPMVVLAKIWLSIGNWLLDEKIK